MTNSSSYNIIAEKHFLEQSGYNSFITRYEATIRFNQDTNVLTFPPRFFPSKITLRIRVLPDGTECGYYEDQSNNSLKVMLPKEVKAGDILVIAFEYDALYTRWELHRRLWLFTFRMDYYIVDLFFEEVPKGTLLYLKHRGYTAIYPVSDGRIKERRVYSGQNLADKIWTVSSRCAEKKVVSIGDEVSAENIVRRFELPELTGDEVARLSFAYTLGPQLLWWLWLLGISAIIGLITMPILFFSMGEVIDKMSIIGTVSIGSFTLLLVTRSWLFSEQIHMAGLLYLDSDYLKLAVLSLTLGMVLNLLLFLCALNLAWEPVIVLKTYIPGCLHE
jgi:hypothetical protein